MKNVYITSTLAAAVIALTSTAAFAGRPPTAEERARLEVALPGQGYSSWGKIEFDDGRWEVDDALDTDGRRYDLKLDRSMTVRESELDD